METKLVPLIIGRKGCVIKKLEADFNVKMSIEAKDDVSSVVTVIGEDVESIKEKLLKISEVQIDVRNKYMPHIIGHKGSVIEKLRRDYNVEIDVKTEDINTRLTIIGENAVSAQDEILHKISALDRAKSSTNQLEMDVETKYVPYIIGQGGRVIEKLKSDHDVRINVKNKNKIKSAVTIIGNDSVLESVKTEILKIIEKKEQDFSRKTITIKVAVPHKKHDLLRHCTLYPKVSDIELIHDVRIKFPEPIWTMSEKKYKKNLPTGVPKDEDGKNSEKNEEQFTKPEDTVFITGRDVENCLAAKERLLEIVPVSVTVEVPYRYRDTLIGANNCIIIEHLKDVTFGIKVAEDVIVVTIAGRKPQVKEARRIIRLKMEEIDEHNPNVKGTK